MEVADNIEGGIFALAGATIVMGDISVLHVRLSECTAGLCPADPYGYGVGAFSASLSLSRFQVHDAALCGAIVAPVPDRVEAALLELESGVVSGSEVGACVQVDGYDLGRLTNDVQYQDNVTSLDATALPVPQVTELLSR